MKFTEEDVPLMKLIFNPETHDMGMLIGRDRADEIWGYVENKVIQWQLKNIKKLDPLVKKIAIKHIYPKDTIKKTPSPLIAHIMFIKEIAEFFYDYKVFDFKKLKNEKGWSNFVVAILTHSPVADKILESKIFNDTIKDKKKFFFMKVYRNPR